MQKVIQKASLLVTISSIFIASGALAATPADFSQALLKFNDQKNAFQKIRQDFGLGNSNIAQVISKGKDFLSNAVDVLQKRDVQLQNRINSDDQIQTDTKNIVLNKITSDLAALDVIKTKISNAATTDDLKSIASELLSNKQISYFSLQKLILLAHIDQVESSIIKISQDRSQKISDKINTLKAGGKNVDELTTLLNQANQKLSDAQGLISQLKTNVSNQSEANLSNIQDTLNQARDLVKDAYTYFKNIALKGNDIFDSSASSTDTNPTGGPSSTSGN